MANGLVPDIAGSISRGLSLRDQIQQMQQAGKVSQIRGALAGIGQPEELPTGFEGPPQLQQEADLIEQAKQIDPVLAEQQLQLLGLDSASKREEASRFAAEIQSLPPELQNQHIQQRAADLRVQGRDPKDTLELLDMNPQQRAMALKGVQLMALSTKERLGITERLAKGTEKPAGQREFEALVATADLDLKQKKEAALIKLGLQPRAVGSAIQTISEKGIADEIGKASAIIKQREKFGEMTGSSRAKAIDKGFDRIVKIDTGLKTIDRAIEALKGGAKTGAIQKFLPSIRSASVELDQIRNELALDVIGSVTFGALSEKELELTKEIALPKGLDEPALIKHLEDRKAAQEKLRAYFQEQIDFLDQGGTVAGFLRLKERQAQPTGQPVPRGTPTTQPSVVQPATPSPTPQIQEGQTATNPQTGEKLIFRGGQWQTP